MTVYRLNLMKTVVSLVLKHVPRDVFDSLICPFTHVIGHLMDSVQSLTDEVTFLKKENVVLTRENIVSFKSLRIVVFYTTTIVFNISVQ